MVMPNASEICFLLPLAGIPQSERVSVRNGVEWKYLRALDVDSHYLAPRLTWLTYPPHFVARVILYAGKLQKLPGSMPSIGLARVLVSDVSLEGWHEDDVRELCLGGLSCELLDTGLMAQGELLHRPLPKGKAITVGSAMCEQEFPFLSTVLVKRVLDDKALLLAKYRRLKGLSTVDCQELDSTVPRLILYIASDTGNRPVGKPKVQVDTADGRLEIYENLESTYTGVFITKDPLLRLQAAKPEMLFQKAGFDPTFYFYGLPWPLVLGFLSLHWVMYQEEWKKGLLQAVESYLQRMVREFAYLEKNEAQTEEELQSYETFTREFAYPWPSKLS